MIRTSPRIKLSARVMARTKVKVRTRTGLGLW